MPRARRDGPLPRAVLCAALTVDGKLADEPPVVPPELYGGNTDPGRHPWAAVYDRAVAVLIDDQLHGKLALMQAAARPIIIVPRQALVAGAADWQGEAREAMRRLSREGRSGYVVCFGGAELFRALLESRMVHEMRLAVGPRVDGRRDAPSLSGSPGAEFFPASIACRLLKAEMREGECLLHYQVGRRRKAEGGR